MYCYEQLSQISKHFAKECNHRFPTKRLYIITRRIKIYCMLNTLFWRIFTNNQVLTMLCALVVIENKLGIIIKFTKYNFIAGTTNATNV